MTFFFGFVACCYRCYLFVLDCCQSRFFLMRFVHLLRFTKFVAFISGCWSFIFFALRLFGLHSFQTQVLLFPLVFSPCLSAYFPDTIHQRTMIDCFGQKWVEGLQNRQSHCGYFMGPLFILGFCFIIMQSILINVEDNKSDVIKSILAFKFIKKLSL